MKSYPVKANHIGSAVSETDKHPVTLLLGYLNIKKFQGASELLGAADQYQLDLLKCLCEEKLCSTTSLDNAVEHLVLGDMYR